MKQFTTVISGYKVTDSNFIEVAKEISKKYGVCPALNSLIMAAIAHDESVECSKKGLNAAIDKYIKIIGYTPKYFNNELRKIGREY